MPCEEVLKVTRKAGDAEAHITRRRYLACAVYPVGPLVLSTHG